MTIQQDESIRNDCVFYKNIDIYTYYGIIICIELSKLEELLIIEVKRKNKWVRSENGWVSGICAGLGKSFGIDPNLLRILWVISVFFYGTGILAYVIITLTLPSENNWHEAREHKFLGVCKRISEQNGIEIGLVRLVALSSFFFSFGITSLIYIVLHFLLPKKSRKIYY